MQPNSLTMRVRHLLKDDKITKLEVIQSLWSGFGEVSRFYWPARMQTIVVKQFCAPEESNHPRGWNTQVSQKRKIDSYINEQVFYRDYAASCDQYCRVPQPLMVEVNNSDQLIVLEDLDAVGFVSRRDHAAMNVVKLGIRWIAYFHGRFINTAAKELWPIGTYWHLGTRKDEWQAMPHGELKEAASRIDQRLNQAKYQTLVHGDAKLANFCFMPDQNDLAAVDFQYVGKGVGVKDLAYFLGCCFSASELFEYQEQLLSCYFRYLKQALKHYSTAINFEQLESEWRTLYPIANADFQRFLSGWSPHHKKLTRYMAAQTKLALTMV